MAERGGKSAADTIRRRADGGAHAQTGREAYAQRGKAWARHEHKRRRRRG